MQTADDPGADRMRRRADVDGAAVGCKPLIRSIACPVLCSGVYTGALLRYGHSLHDVI